MERNIDVDAKLTLIDKNKRGRVICGGYGLEMGSLELLVGIRAFNCALQQAKSNTVGGTLKILTERFFI
ncbi:hypothetical protein [Vibrio sp. SCSIO 43139]|uniref:hypothetical protein n=1 Tax=Vibrio sp. SCSIO 43139 TaxID=2819102 RepID=UPI0020758E84|nr:hypothetical protein [Vibrio sp. SCSIO 43139]USD72718.1 hypothetical protein J4N41_22555 [Vibrio sp. SCSIO 43139]